MRPRHQPISFPWLAVALLGTLTRTLGAQQAPSSTPAQPAVTLTVGEVVKDFDAAWQSIKDTFVDPKTYGVDWDALKKEYRPKVQGAADATAAYKLLAEMIGKIQSPNTGVIPPWLKPPSADPNATPEEPLLQYGGVGILLQTQESGEVYALQIFRGTPAEKAGVLVGDIITGVDDWRVTGDDAVSQVTQRVRGVVGTRVTLTLRDPEGKERRLDITRAQIDLRPSVDHRVVSGTIGYIRLPVLSKVLVDEAAKALPSLLSTNGLILDLRSVSSGTLDQMVVVAQWFLGAAHMGGFVSRSGAEVLPYNKEANAAYQRPMVVLTNSSTYGIAEVLAFILKQYRRAGLLGTDTAGSFEITGEVTLPSGGLLEVAIGRFASVQGDVLPLGGLAPNVKVDPPDLATLREGRDLAIEKAVETLRTNPRW
jgi:carboxyl-terminal processing protease